MLVGHTSMALLVVGRIVAAGVFSIPLLALRLHAWDGVELEKLRSPRRLVHSV